MKKFILDTRGNASLWAAFLMVVLFLLAIVAYTGATLYSTYQSAQTELERATNVSVDTNLVNANVRDLLLDIPAEDAAQKVYANLALAGYVQCSDYEWERMEGGKTRYRLKDMQITVSGKVLDITATLSMPLPWAVGSLSSAELPINVESRVLYLD